MLRILRSVLPTIFIIVSLTAHGIDNDQNSEMKAIEKIAISNSEKYKDYIVGKSGAINKISIDEAHNIKDFLSNQKISLDSAFSQGKPRPTSDILVFVSFSMPKNALISILKQSNKYNAQVILRGLKDNSMPQTIAEISELIKESKAKAGFQIDPNLFNEYNINKVPAIAKVNNDNFDVVYGLANIEDALYVFKSS